jgi:hypothetical protein
MMDTNKLIDKFTDSFGKLIAFLLKDIMFITLCHTHGIDHEDIDEDDQLGVLEALECEGLI